MRSVNKQCSKCGEEKSLASFTVDLTRSDGLEHRCRDCKQLSNKKSRALFLSIPIEKWCGGCKQIRPWSEFSKCISSSDGLAFRCKQCLSEYRRITRRDNPVRYQNYHRKSKYKLSPSDYESMLARQNNQCAICQTDNPGGGWSTFAVDHCHQTNKIRGLLCISCNNGLGRFKDNSIFLRAAADYLETQLDNMSN